MKPKNKQFIGFSLFVLILILSDNVYAQTVTQEMNYIHTFEVQVPNVKDPASLNINSPTTTALQTIQYIDGIGRPVQIVQIGITPNGNDLIKPIVYNGVGLDEINFEPYSSKTNSGEYRQDFLSKQPEYYFNLFNDSNGKSPVEYEKSPLQRIQKQGSPGDDWQLNSTDHYVSYQYLANDNSDPKLTALNWYVEGNTCKKGLNYPNNELFVIKTINEDGAESFEFKDKLGQVLLKRSVLENGSLVNTYYVYDDFGLLRFVISPEGAMQITSDFTAESPDASKFVYCYQYDANKRLIQKQIPGKAPEYYVYDKTNKPVLYQDGNMRNGTLAEWMFTKYDAMGRSIITGIIYVDKNKTRAMLQDEANNATIKCWEIVNFIGPISATDINFYSNNSFPTLVPSYYKILTINYYDTYRLYNSATSSPVLLCNSSELILNQTNGNSPVYEPFSSNVIGLNTVSYTSFDQLGMMLASLNYYDKYGRINYSGSTHHLEGYDLTLMQYKGITNNVSDLEHRHYSKKQKIAPYTYTYSKSERFTYEYDMAGRQTGYEYTFNLNPVKQIVTNSYDDVGRLISKQIGEGAYSLQTINYEYNIRGWLAKINNPNQISNTDDLFGMELYYNSAASDIGNVPSYAGNISAIKWQCAQPSGTTSPNTTGIKAYSYLYDKLNRLLYGKYSEKINGVWTANERYSEYIHTGSQSTSYRPYDLNGNILTINRFGMKSPNNTLDLIDQLTYNYEGNKLIAVDDNVTTNNGGDFVDNYQIYSTTHQKEYEYDANGNLTKDNNKGILNISYNTLNLPVSINKTGSMRVEYYYDAKGTKRQQRYYTNIEGSVAKVTDFIGNFVYENGVPAYNIYDEGRIVYNSDGTYFGEAYIKDHLGNVRVACRLDHGTIKVRQVDSYYPFGMSIKGLSQNSTDAICPNEYLYNGKMMQDEMGLNLLDYGARFYDAVLGRFHSEDRFAEKYLNLSSYQYAANNPINLIDINGDSIWFSYQYNKANELTGVTMHVSGKVINVSNNDIDMDAATVGISDQLKSSFRGEFDGISFNTETHLTVAKNMDDIGKSDHVFALAEMSNGGLDGISVAGASNKFGGKVAFIDADYFTGPWDKYIGNTGKSTAGHEFGHLANLKHISTSFNLMKSGGGNSWFYPSTNVSSNQLKSIYNAYKSGIVNQGGNVEYVPVYDASKGMWTYKKMPDRGMSKPYVIY